MPGDMNVLLVGTGPMAQAYGLVLNALGVPWRAVGRGAKSAAAFEAACGVRPVTGGLAAYLAQGGLDPAQIVILVLPLAELAAATRQVANAGAARILVEKPGGLTVDEIEATAAATVAAGAQVFIAYNRRFYTSAAVARAMIAEDGGVTSFHFEFTEVDSRKRLDRYGDAVLQSWFLANSSHVVDLAFHLGGKPLVAEGMTAGVLPWHSAGSVFAGHGRTEAGALFTWHADWSSAGRWSLDLRTARRRLLLQPLEQLHVQEKGSFEIERVTLDDEADRCFKPGLYRQVEAVLSENPADRGLPTLVEQALQARRWASMICPGPASGPPVGTVERISRAG